MGLFDSLTDVFTGDSAKKAEENKQLLQQNQTTGTGTLLSNLTAGTTTLQGGHQSTACGARFLITPDG